MRKPPYAGIRRRAVLVLASVLAAVVVVGVLSINYTAGLALTSFRQTIGGVLRPLVPKEAIICQGSVSAQCAQRAAGRVGHTVAWLPLPPSPGLMLAAAPHDTRNAFKNVDVAGTILGLSLESPSQSDPQGRVVRTVMAHGVRAQVRQSNDGISDTFLRIDWRYRGRPYEIWGFTLPRPPGSADVDTLVALWRSVRYAEPA